MVSGVSSSFSKPAVPRRACGILLVSLIAVPYRNGCQGGLTDLLLLSLLSNRMPATPRPLTRYINSSNPC